MIVEYSVVNDHQPLGIDDGNVHGPWTYFSLACAIMRAIVLSWLKTTNINLSQCITSYQLCLVSKKICDKSVLPCLHTDWSYFIAAFQQCERHAGANQASVGPQGVRRGPGDGHSPSDHELPLQLAAAAHRHSRALRLLSVANPSSQNKSGSANIAV